MKTNVDSKNISEMMYKSKEIWTNTNPENTRSEPREP